MKKFEVPDFDGDGNYLTRWRILQTPWASLYLHRIDTPDSRPTLHDHPWSFIAFVLRGGYVERRLDPLKMQVNEHRVVRRINIMRRGDYHAIMRLLGKPTWTLLLVGSRRRTWGYLEPTAGDSWVWTEFDKHPHAAEYDAAMARRHG